MLLASYLIGKSSVQVWGRRNQSPRIEPLFDQRLLHQDFPEGHIYLTIEFNLSLYPDCSDGDRE